MSRGHADNKKEISRENADNKKEMSRGLFGALSRESVWACLGRRLLVVTSHTDGVLLSLAALLRLTSCSTGEGELHRAASACEHLRHACACMLTARQF